MWWSGPCSVGSRVRSPSVWMRCCRRCEVMQPLSGSQMKAQQGVVADNRTPFDLWHGRLLHTLTSPAHSQSAPTSLTQGQTQSRCLPTQLQLNLTPHAYSHSVTPDYMCGTLWEGFVTCFGAQGRWKICRNGLNKAAHSVVDAVQRLI